MALWYWPDGLYMLIPFLVSVLLVTALFIEHVLSAAPRRSWKFRFQVLYVRLIGILPCMALGTLMTSFWPQVYYWVAVAVSLLEIYVIVGLFALVCGLGWLKTHGKFSDVMASAKRRRLPVLDFLTSDWYRSPYCCCGIWRGCREAPVETGDEVFRRYKWLVLQVAIFKPIAVLLEAIYAQIKGNTARGVFIGLGFIDAVSTILAMAALLRVFVSAREAPGLPLRKHNIVGKILVLKLLFLFVVFNNVILIPLIDSGALPIPAWMCDPALYSFAANAISTTIPPLSNTTLDQNQFYCEERFSAIVFMLEIVFLCVPAVFNFRHHELSEDASSSEKKKKQQNGNDEQPATALEFTGRVFCGPLGLRTLYSGKFLKKHQEYFKQYDAEEGGNDVSKIVDPSLKMTDMIKEAAETMTAATATTTTTTTATTTNSGSAMPSSALTQA